jgi:hypothetical protein
MPAIARFRYDVWMVARLSEDNLSGKRRVELSGAGRGRCPRCPAGRQWRIRQCAAGQAEIVSSGRIATYASVARQGEWPIASTGCVQ